MSHQHNIPRGHHHQNSGDTLMSTSSGNGNTGPLHHRHQNSINNNSNNNNNGGFGFNNNSSPFDEGSMVMQMGLRFGNQIIDEGKGRLSSIETSELRRRFSVTHEFVVAKLRLLAFPFRQKFLRTSPSFSSESNGILGSDNIDLLSNSNNNLGGGSPSTANASSSLDPASGDPLALDLYLPLMSLITYVVCCAFGTGLLTPKQLSPSELATTVVASTVLIVFESLLIKLWRMVTILPPPVFLDTVALFGYFFVNVCYSLVARALFDAWLPLVSWAVTLYFLGAFCWFMYKSLADSFDKDGSLPKRAIPILYAATLIQAPLFLWFVRRAY